MFVARYRGYRGAERLLISEIPEVDLDMVERAVRNEGQLLSLLMEVHAMLDTGFTKIVGLQP